MFLSIFLSFSHHAFKCDWAPIGSWDARYTPTSYHIFIFRIDKMGCTARTHTFCVEENPKWYARHTCILY